MSGLKTVDRGQTSFDFVVGMAVFLVTVGFVMMFIPGVFAPFTIGSGNAELVSDRAAAAMVGDVLVDDRATPTILNETCTVAFFAGNTPADCRFSTTDLNPLLEIPNDRLNVTILQPETDAIATINGQDLNTGPTPESDADVTSARRMVSINGTLYELRVRVW